MNNRLTPKQENFCQAFVRLGDKSAAYREAYSVGNMKPATVNNNAYMLFQNSDISARIKTLQQEAVNRSKATVDELIIGLTGIIRFDPADMYDENGKLKNIHDIPKEVRMCMAQIKTTEEYIGNGKDREVIGYSKDVKTYDKLQAFDKLMRHLGLYEKDNMQKSNIFSSEDRAARLSELKSKL